MRTIITFEDGSTRERGGCWFKTIHNKCAIKDDRGLSLTTFDKAVVDVDWIDGEQCYSNADCPPGYICHGGHAIPDPDRLGLEDVEATDDEKRIAEDMFRKLIGK